MTAARSLEPRRLGSGGLRVFPLALGCMGMSGMYGQADEQESIATVHGASEPGATLLSRGTFEGGGTTEMLVAGALGARGEKALFWVKSGGLGSPDGACLGNGARPPAVKNFLSHSLSRLDVDHI